MDCRRQSGFEQTSLTHSYLQAVGLELRYAGNAGLPTRGLKHLLDEIDALGWAPP